MFGLILAAVGVALILMGFNRVSLSDLWGHIYTDAGKAAAKA